MYDLDCHDSFTRVFAEAGNPEVAKFHPLHAHVIKDIFGFDVLMENFELKQKIAQGDLHLPVDVREMWDFDLMENFEPSIQSFGRYGKGR